VGVVWPSSPVIVLPTVDFRDQPGPRGTQHRQCRPPAV